MGTNYYVTDKNDLVDRLRGKEETYLHIGKSSGGWCFSLRVHKEHNLRSLTDWYRYLRRGSKVITDEYDRVVTLRELLSIITERSWKRDPTLPRRMGPFEELGPNGLSRHMEDSRTTHGPGTWDLIDSDFS